MKYRKNLDFAKSIIAALPPEVVPEELRVTAVHMRMCDTSWLDPRRFGEDCWELKKECATLRRECSELPNELLGKAEEKLQKPNIFRRADLYRWLIQLEVRMGHGFHTDMFDVGHYDDICNRRTLSNRNRPMPDVVADDNPQTSMSGEVEGGGKTVVTPPPGDMSRKFAANAMKEFNALKSLTEISEIRDSVGELYVRSIMAYASRLEGRSAVSFESLERCGEIIIKHPGLCRFTTWKHMTHRILNVLAGKGYRHKYTMLRDVYNSMVDEPGTQKAPPFEEFTGVRDICDGFFCRSICSDEIIENPGIGGISTPSSEASVQELSPTKDSFPGHRIFVTPPLPPTLENASSLSLNMSQDGREQLQPAVPSDHLRPLERYTSAFSGRGATATGAGLHTGARDETNWVGWNTTAHEGGGYYLGGSCG